MKKFLFAFLTFLLLASPVAIAQETDSTSANIAALKSFGAWYLKNRDQGYSIHEAFDGWLADPAVPDRFKITGLERQQDMEDAVNQLAQMRDQASQSAGEMAQDIANAASEAKKKAEDIFNKWIDSAISGEQGATGQ